jgi:hypothetical protein
MWIVQCNPNIDSPSWSTLGSYDNKASAITHAFRVSDEGSMVIVVDSDDNVIWTSSNNQSLSSSQFF